MTLLGKSPEELKDVATTVGMKPFAAKQLAEWIYVKHAKSFDEMTNISLAARTKLKESYEIGFAAPVWSAKSKDGTTKYLFQTTHGPIETVFIPEEDRGTICVSCQVGCKMNCQFCMTGKQGWSGDLSACEIMNQIMSIPEYSQLTNIVFMGMGEPMDNVDEILRCCEILTAKWGFGWSPHRITVSTVGVIPAMKRFIDSTDCHLAVSLHNPFGDERAKIMPVEKRHQITDIVATLKQYDWTHQRRISFEYIIIKGFNDTLRHAAEIVRMMQGLECRVNLIRWHAIPGMDLHSPEEDKIVWFRDYLTENGITCTIRKSRGEDIQAACGLLSSTHTK
ncbi:MAG: 23S rRNA (adenine(2503)-C(2))-methyltransferase RlmN [Paludibacteraceae bacterium]|nr:23S rRNA (adenine(2503)-C(2))-methyltransferase RlmN [Paludibacteraceae bacterium]